MTSQTQVPWNSSRGGKKFKIGESPSHHSLGSHSISATSPHLPPSTSAQQNIPVPSQGSASASQSSQRSPPLYQTRRPLQSQEPHSTTRPRVAIPPFTARYHLKDLRPPVRNVNQFSLAFDLKEES
jgi:hypothetical protein